MGMLEEFKKFAMRGNVVDMAVGIVIGAAFGQIVTSLVDKDHFAADRLLDRRRRFQRQGSRCQLAKPLVEGASGADDRLGRVRPSHRSTS